LFLIVFHISCRIRKLPTENIIRLIKTAKESIIKLFVIDSERSVMERIIYVIPARRIFFPRRLYWKFPWCCLVAKWLIYQRGIQDIPTASAAPETLKNLINMRFKMRLTGMIIARIRARSRTRPVPARNWKFICIRRLKIRNGAENLSICPDVRKASPKNATASSSQN